MAWQAPHPTRSIAVRPRAAASASATYREAGGCLQAESAAHTASAARAAVQGCGPYPAIPLMPAGTGLADRRFPSDMNKSPPLVVVLSVLVLSSGCTEAEPATDMWEQTGELVALSGGDAGAGGACISCHGLDGLGDGNRVPRIAGLDPGYFVRQMDAFANGQRRHPQMTWIADHLDWPSRQKVARYYAQLPVPDAAPVARQSTDCAATRLYHRGDPGRGLASCASCHGDDGGGVGEGNPPLARQPAPYLEDQLRAWAHGERYGDAGNVMTRISRTLTESERAGLAAYSSALPDASENRGLRATCREARRPDPSNGA